VLWARLTWIVKNLPNTEVVDIGEGIHFLQVNKPRLIRETIASWCVSPEQGTSEPVVPIPESCFPRCFALVQFDHFLIVLYNAFTCFLVHSAREGMVGTPPPHSANEKENSHADECKRHTDSEKVGGAL